MMNSGRAAFRLLIEVTTGLCSTVGAPVAAQTYDLVIRNGRVMDPASGLDAVRSIGIKGVRIAAISAGPLSGKTIIDVSGGLRFATTTG